MKLNSVCLAQLIEIMHSIYKVQSLNLDHRRKKETGFKYKQNLIKKNDDVVFLEYINFPG